MMNHAAHKPDYVLLGLVGTLIVAGLLVLSSASSIVGFERFGDSYHFIKRQVLFGLIPGLLAFFFFLKFDYRRLQLLAAPILLGALALLVIVLIPGIGLKVGIAQRWIRIGPVGIQPSEFAKLALTIFLAAWFARPERSMADVKKTIFPFAVVVGVVLGLIILQPDIGTALVLSIIGGGVYVLAGAKAKHVATLGALFVAATLILVLIKPHAAERITTFLHPDTDPLGAGYQISQAYLAIGSGGWVGQGFGHSRAKFKYLPEAYGDSIFAIIGEELGFILSSIFIGLYALFFGRGMVVARHVPDRFGQLLAGGIALWLTGQALLNISAMVGLVPLTGIPLPFVSYGGSALAVALGGVGILANISTRSHLRQV